ncbi:hypothetical protein BV22DRAFT_1198444 [Leucogyrophana mollusca]|uniref:Uncharacterized protein n=1 Tax=Leucogyrophana mollusca TaxID=85980 RepID=A0ACB8B7D6_9AGAM|nr:hypothetical protein BV22DRAFT_1198444 [Leucogyrophana mollusca]
MSGTKPHTSHNPALQEGIERQLVKETKGYYVGAMNVDSFLGQFLPLSPDSPPCPTVSRDKFTAITSGGKEPSMYQPLIDAISPCTEGLEVVNTGNRPDTDIEIGGYHLKPDITIYDGSCKGQKKTDFKRLEMWIEVKPTESYDAFEDPDEEELQNREGEALASYLRGWKFESDTADGIRTRGQLTAYGLAQLGSQFRTFAFSVFICGKYARLLRWDRAGVTVTRRFDYTAQPELLLGFFWRFRNAKPEHRGIDLSVTPASDAECKLARRALLLRPDAECFRYEVPEDDHSKQVREPYVYVGPRPPFPSFSLIGRATRTLPVYDPLKNNVVYLKDTWRIDHPEIGKEGDIYHQLHHHHVPHVAPFERGNDVRGGVHRTVTQVLAEEPWVCGPRTSSLTAHIHYRMALGVVGRELTTFKSTCELVTALADAVEAHKHAYEDAGILHRDISVGNIILKNDGTGGLLIDWDLCKPLNKESRRRHDRTGTWQFMAAALLQNPQKLHELQDDLESFLHVLTWSTIRYCPSNLSALERGTYLRLIFDEAIDTDDGTTGGLHKGNHLGHGRYLPARRGEGFQFSVSSPLLDLLKAFSGGFVARYQTPPTDAERKTFEQQKAQAVADNNPNWLKYLLDHPFEAYDRALRALTNSDWVLSILRSYAKGKHGAWPTDDAAQRQPIVSNTDETAYQHTVHANRVQKLEENRLNSRGLLVSGGSGSGSKREADEPPASEEPKRSRDNNGGYNLRRG